MKREKCFKPEDPETITVNRLEFATLLKVYAQGGYKLTRIEHETFKGILEKFVDAYNGRTLNEAYNYFHGKDL